MAGVRVNNVRLFNDTDFDNFIDLCDSTSSDWVIANGTADELKAGDVRVERRPCPKGKYFDVFRVSVAIDSAPFGSVENALRQISNVLLDSAYRKTWDNRCAFNGTIARIGRANYVGFYGGIAPTPISGRDFCTLKSWRFNYKGECSFASCFFR